VCFSVNGVGCSFFLSSVLLSRDFEFEFEFLGMTSLVEVFSHCVVYARVSIGARFRAILFVRICSVSGVV